MQLTCSAVQVADFGCDVRCGAQRRCSCTRYTAAIASITVAAMLTLVNGAYLIQAPDITFTTKAARPMHIPHVLKGCTGLCRTILGDQHLFSYDWKEAMPALLIIMHSLDKCSYVFGAFGAVCNPQDSQDIVRAIDNFL